MIILVLFYKTEKKIIKKINKKNNEREQMREDSGKISPPMDRATRLDCCNFDIYGWSNGHRLDPLGVGIKTGTPQVIYIPINMETPEYPSSQRGNSSYPMQHSEACTVF